MKKAACCMLLTGGRGRLGTELQALLPDVIAPDRQALDITDEVSVVIALKTYKPQLLIHAAAYTDVAGAERDPRVCWQVNVGGTQIITRAALAAAVPLIHISTDYVFAGDRGQYLEDDPLGPALNAYALSKIAAEAAVRVHPEHLIIRTSFRPRHWPYPVAFEDMFTTQDYVDVIAPDIALAIRQYKQIPFQTLHIVKERKSVFELAKRRAPEVRPSRKAKAPVHLPDDISLDSSRWQQLKPLLGGAEGKP